MNTTPDAESNRTGRPPKSRYTLTGPCSNCPFRNDQPSYLRPDRVAEIGDALLDGQDFWCHKTVDYSDAPDASSRDGVVGRTRACGGAMATLLNEGRSTQMKRITERLGLPVADTDPEAPVYESIEAWARAKSSD